MKITAKILYFNPTQGEGILITSKKEKFVFGAGVWNDFEVMPSLGLEVECICERGEILKISALAKEEHTCDVEYDVALQRDSIMQEISLNIAILPDDALPPKEESISISMNLPKAVNNYFNIIKEHILKRRTIR